MPYGNYGNLMRIILYHYTKDVVWIKTLPESQPALGIQSMRDRMIDEANLDFEQSQTYLDRASSLERKAQEQRQKALDIQKSAVYRALQACNFFKKTTSNRVLLQIRLMITLNIETYISTDWFVLHALKPHLLSMSTTAFSNCNPFSTAVVLIGTYFLTIFEIFRLFQNHLFLFLRL